MRRSVIIFLASSLLLVANTAAAKDLNGRFGVGGQRTSLGTEGVAVRYWAGHIGASLVLGMTSISRDVRVEDEAGFVKEASQTATGIDATLRVVFNAARAQNTNLFVGGGFTVGTAMTKVPGLPDDTETSTTELGFEIVLGAEHFFSNHFSVQAEVGIPMRFPGEDGAAIAGGGGQVSPGSLEADAGVTPKGGGGLGYALGKVPGFGAGFTFYF